MSVFFKFSAPMQNMQTQSPQNFVFMRASVTKKSKLPNNHITLQQSHNSIRVKNNNLIQGENGNDSGDFQRPMAQIFNCLPAPVVNNFIVVNRPLPTVLNEFMRCRPQLPGPMEFQRALNMKVQNIPGNKRPAGVNNVRDIEPLSLYYI